jgi:hypothetical protein
MGDERAVRRLRDSGKEPTPLSRVLASCCIPGKPGSSPLSVGGQAKGYPSGAAAKPNRGLPLRFIHLGQECSLRWANPAKTPGLIAAGIDSREHEMETAAGNPRRRQYLIGNWPLAAS